jgi:hypothetical protein
MTTKQSKQLLLAMSIGDGHVNQRNGLQICHSAKQQTYCEAKAKLLSDALERNVIVHHYESNGHSAVRFQVNDHYTKFVRKWLYPNGKKKLSLAILRRLTDQGIALWYMDDGSLIAKKRNGKVHAYELVISTYCETEEETVLICDFFNERYGVKMTVKRNKGRFSVRCGTKQARRLLEHLNPWVLDGMEYKFAIPDSIDWSY